MNGLKNGIHSMNDRTGRSLVVVLFPQLSLNIYIKVVSAACKESRVRQPGASGFCDWASEIYA